MLSFKCAHTQRGHTALLSAVGDGFPFQSGSGATLWPLHIAQIGWCVSVLWYETACRTFKRSLFFGFLGPFWALCGPARVFTDPQGTQ